MLTGGQVADCTAGSKLLEQLPDCKIVHADKGYDADGICRHIAIHGAMPNIPTQSQSQMKELLLARSLQRSKRHRAHVLSPQGFPENCEPIRSKCCQLPRCRMHRSRRQLLLMGPDPNAAQGPVAGAQGQLSSASRVGKVYDLFIQPFCRMFCNLFPEFMI